MIQRLFYLSLAIGALARNVSLTNCMADSIVSPRFVPIDADVDLDQVNKVIYYRITGTMVGQINDTNADNTLASAVTDTLSVAGYTQSKTNHRLCETTRDPLFASNRTVCPFGPGLVALEFQTALNASYIFSSLTSQIRINGPTTTNYEVGCFELTITPPFSRKINDILTYIPLVVLLLMGTKVVIVAIGNPWSGTIDPYRSFSNFGVDPNALRMLTPGFSDCLAYLQFAAYSSMLRLDYPGYFQPVTSRISWALLLFDSSPISKALDYTPVQSSSLTTYINFVGSSRQAAWKSFMIWWFILQACTLALGLLIIALWWLLTPSSTDMTRKNLPFLAGCLLRSYYWMLLPFSLFTAYQLMNAQQSYAASTALSALVFMILIILGPVCLLYHLARYHPRQDLFDDIIMLNLFGPLYNTFSEASLLLFIPNMLLSIARGFTVAFLQDYGTAQIVLLTLFEVVNLAALLYFRPWPRSTNTTLLTLLLGAFRLVIILLMISFLSGLNIPSGKREWVGYVILVMHAVILILGFLGNALLSLLELFIRLLVIVPHDEGARAIFGARQLRSRARKRASQVDRSTHQHTTSDNSLSGLLDNKENSPFFRAPRNPSRISSRVEVESPVLDVRSSTVDSDGFRSPLGRDTSYPSTIYLDKAGKQPHVRALSFQSEDVLNSTSRPGSATPNRLDSIYDMYDLALAPTEDAARRGVDYAVREADVYHPQSSGELLGPSKKLGTGPADPNGIRFRKFNWAPWKKEKNEEKGKFVVVRSTPAPTRSANVPLQPIKHTDTQVDPVSTATAPRYNALQEEDHHELEEEEEDDDEYNHAQNLDFVLDESPSHVSRRATGGVFPVLPRLNLPATNQSSFEPFHDLQSPTENQALFDTTEHGGHGLRSLQRQPSQDSDDSYVSILATPLRPIVGDRMSSHHSAQTEGSVRSTRVRDSYVESPSANIQGYSAEVGQTYPSIDTSD